MGRVRRRADGWTWNDGVVTAVAPAPDRPAVVPFGDQTTWARAHAILAAGGCLVLPTDTVYGVAAAAGHRGGVAALQAAKGRDDQFPPPVLVDQASQAWGLTSRVPEAARRLAEAYWPGPLTLILATDRDDLSLSGLVGSVGLRVPGHTVLRAFLAATGPLAVSSANRHDQAPATDVAQAIVQLGDAVGLYFDGGPTPGPGASTVVDCTGEQAVVVREGLLSRHQIETVAGGGDA